MHEDDGDFEGLCGRYLDGTLSAEDRERFVTMLESDPGRVAELQSQILVSGALARMRPEQSDETFLQAMLPHLGTVGSEDAEVFPLRVKQRIRVSRIRRAALAIAAVIALAAALTSVWPGKGKSDGEVVATLFHADASRAVHIGEKLKFSEGVSRVEFSNGAVVAIEAPAALSIRSAVEVMLDHGRLNAWCPESAHGFRVATGAGTLTDLGTSFGVSTSADGTTDFVVMDGKVEVEKDGETRTVVKGGAVQAGRGKRLRDVAFEPLPFHHTWPVASGIHSTRGEVVPAPPGTPEALAAMENDERILVIPERRDFKPASPLRVDILEPGTFAGPDLVAPLEFVSDPGAKIRSYLLRYNPVGKGKPIAFKRFVGSVTFDRPVLAIIVASRKLNRSDNVLSKAPLPTLNVVDAGLRGLERTHPSNRSDRVELSSDRHTVNVTFFAGESVDEIRAITADD
jgi:ferric-dicitrate binding protein FerR (iron transport regulator)